VQNGSVAIHFIPYLTMHFKDSLLLLPALTLGLTSCGSDQAEPEARAFDQRASVFSPSTQAHATLASDRDGRYMVAWDSRRQEAGNYGVFARAFDALGRPLSHELHVNLTQHNMQFHPSVTFAADDSAWFAWQSHGQDGSGASIVARQFVRDASLGYQAAGSEIAVNQVRLGDQTLPVLAANTEGSVLAVYGSQMPSDGSQSARFELRARRIDQADTQEWVISQPNGGSDSLPSLCALPDGRFLLAWARSQAAQGDGIWAQYLSGDGQVYGDAFRLSDNPNAIEPGIDADGQGNFVAAWMQEANGGYAVYARRFSADAQAQSAAQQIAGAEQGWNSGVAVSMRENGEFLIAYNNDQGSSLAKDAPADQPGENLQIVRFSATGELQSEFSGSQFKTGRQAMTAATGARRALFAEHGQIALAWDGDAGLGDESAVHLSLLRDDAQDAKLQVALADQAVLLAEPQVANIEMDAATLLANPPIWDPNWQPQDRLLYAAAASGDFGFEAVPGTGWTPPDPEMAVGPDRIAVMVNGRIALFDKNGNEQWKDEIENSFGFWGGQGATGFVFDPEVCWDPHAQRFIAMACERSSSNRSTFLLAVSKDATPDDANDWHKYRIDVTGISGNDIDSPNLSVSSDYILLTADFFGPDKYLLYIIDKSSVLGGGTVVATSELITGSSQQSMGIPVVYDNDATLYVLQSTESGSNNSVIFHAITNPFTAYSRVTQTLNVANYSYPNQPPQKGSSSRPFLFEPRFWSVAQRNGSIWAVHHVNGSRARVRWYEFALNGWPTTSTPSVAQWGEIDLGPGIHTYFPSIHVDALNNAAITYARSASNEYISMGRVTRSASDPAGEFRSSQVVQTSNNAHTSGRWGDYSGTQAEPTADGTFWGHHEFTNGSTGSWRTWVARYDMRPAGLNLQAATLTAGASATLTATGATPGARVYFVYSTVGTALTEEPALSTTFSLDAPILLGNGTASASGMATYTRNVPPTAAGTKIWLQAAEFGESSNWYSVTIQ
jgi:hypothetical protein